MNRRLGIAACAALVAAVQTTAVAQPPPSVAERARGAEHVVVASVSDVTASFATNEHGDHLIVSHVLLRVEEALKGKPAPSIVVDVEGGTVGDLTLEVSSLPRLTPGERAVFFVNRNQRGQFVPHLRGLGILKLDRANRVPGTGLDLAAIRRATAAGR